MGKELEYAIAKEREWREKLGKTDTGSYCEEAGHDCKMTRPVLAAYKALVDALLQYQRSGLK